jgi:hypothetical protein
MVGPVGLQPTTSPLGGERSRAPELRPRSDGVRRIRTVPSGLPNLRASADTSTPSMAGVGIEPTSPVLRTSATPSQLTSRMVGAPGVEPDPRAPKARMLPKHLTPPNGIGGTRTLDLCRAKAALFQIELRPRAKACGRDRTGEPHPYQGCALPPELRRQAGWTGLEPATSGVTGRRSCRLNYHPE